MLRLSAKGLGLAAALVLLAHALLLGRELPAPSGEAVPALAWPLLASLFTGRVALALLPPGEVGSHAWRDLASTLAASLVLGSLLVGSVPLPWALGSALLLALGRWLTLPGAMVPRHRPPDQTHGSLDRPFALAVSAWAAYLFSVAESALLWLALFAVLAHGLGVARRARGGRRALLVLGAALAPHLVVAPAPALGLGLGASFLVPWLRRADRRAGVLAMLAFGSVLREGPTLLALAGPIVLVAASHPRQRRFAALGVALSALAFLALGIPAEIAQPARGRMLWLPELVSSALDRGVWGLAWPAVLLALALGALAFDWRAREWTPGTIEQPRREARALLALILLACAALAPPFSPWAEEEVLVILFPPCAFLAGLLLAPPEPAPA